MAPEVIKQDAYDFKADIWSLGITAYELAKGEPPYSDLHPMRVLLQIPKNPPPQLQGNFSRLFKEFVEMCLQKDPGNRPTAKELLRHPFIRKAKRNTYLVELIERFREWKRDRAHQQQQSDSESDSDDENECNGSRNDMMADSGWVETIRDKSYTGAGGAVSKSGGGKEGKNNASEFMSKHKEVRTKDDQELNKEFRQMNIDGSDMMGDKISPNFKLQQNVIYIFNIIYTFLV